MVGKWYGNGTNVGFFVDQPECWILVDQSACWILVDQTECWILVDQMECWILVDQTEFFRMGRGSSDPLLNRKFLGNF